MVYSVNGSTRKKCYLSYKILLREGKLVMKKHIVVTLCLLITTLGYGQPKEENTIEWQQNRKLTWSDFKGPAHNWNVAAVTYCGIKIEPVNFNKTNGKATYKITTYFITDSSFYFKNKADTFVLSHEQAHFDIAELYARRMRAVLADKGVIVFKEANTIYQRFYKEYLNFQQKYETKTKHGTNLPEQKKWEELIAAELNKLSKFKN
jgi:hypothetical protein